MNNLGEKIRQYRKRAKLSQMELELEMGAASGSISRIENGEVNPSKETLSKIATPLNLNTSEIGDLLDLKIFSPLEIIKAINKISKSFDLNTTLQSSVDILYKLYSDYNGGLIFLKEGKYLCAKTISRMPKIEIAQKLLPKSINQFHLSLDKVNNNFLKISTLENRVLESKNLYDFCRGEISNSLTQLIANVLNFKVGLSVPLIFDQEIIGVVMFTKTNVDYYTFEEKELLKLLSDQIAINLRKVEINE